MKRFLRKNGLFVVVLALILIYMLTCSHYIVLSGSMEPTLHTGSAVIIRNGSMPGIGDICAYENSGNIVIHRVADITDDGKYIMKGDANVAADVISVAPEKIRGKVILRINFIAPLIRRLAGL